MIPAVRLLRADLFAMIPLFWDRSLCYGVPNREGRRQLRVGLEAAAPGVCFRVFVFSCFGPADTLVFSCFRVLGPMAGARLCFVCFGALCLRALTQRCLSGSCPRGQLSSPCWTAVILPVGPPLSHTHYSLQLLQLLLLHGAHHLAVLLVEGVGHAGVLLEVNLGNHQLDIQRPPTRA